MTQMIHDTHDTGYTWYMVQVSHYMTHDNHDTWYTWYMIHMYHDAHDSWPENNSKTLESVIMLCLKINKIYIYIYIYIYVNINI